MSALARWAGPPAAAVLLLLLSPGEAYGWGPGTHLYLGEEILRHLALLGPVAGALLSSRPRAFLYGTLAPDLLVAKDRAPEGSHSHRWVRTDELRRAAGGDGDRMAAVLGYRAHLAADAVAHGFFLPRRMLLTASTRSIGHSYWEHRVEAGLPDGYPERARALIRGHVDGPVEGLFREVLTPTLFDFATNRRIYGEMVRWSNHEAWQSLFGRLVDSSRWRLDAGEQRRALAVSVALALGAIRDAEDVSPGDGDRIRGLDPTGREAMERAKELRRSALRSGRWDARWEPSESLRRTADRRFPLPAVRSPADPRPLEFLLAAVGVGEGERSAPPEDGEPVAAA